MQHSLGELPIACIIVGPCAAERSLVLERSRVVGLRTVGFLIVGDGFYTGNESKGKESSNHHFSGDVLLGGGFKYVVFSPLFGEDV